MRIFLKLLLAGTLLSSAGFSLYQLRQLSAMKKALATGGTSSAEALSQLAKNDKTGVVRDLITAQVAQLERLSAVPEGSEGGPEEAKLKELFGQLSGGVATGDTPGSESASAQAQPASPPVVGKSKQVLFTPNAKVDVFKAGEAAPAPREGGAVLIDHKTGQRFVIQGSTGASAAVSRRAAAAKREVGGAAARLQRELASRFPGLPAGVSDALSDGLEARRNRAYAALLATVGLTIFLVWLARRMLKD